MLIFECSRVIRNLAAGTDGGVLSVVPNTRA